MALAQLELQITLTEINCGCCGGTYAINERYRQHKYDKSGFWHCPYCECSWGYEKGELQMERERHQETLSRLNEERSKRKRIERKLTRVGRGVCPECNRTFENLARHMACKHKAAK